MDFVQTLTWVMTTLGFIGFIFAGQRKWWAWYINSACQILWATYALVTGQLAFLVYAAAYFVIFAYNAYMWTKDHLVVKRMLQEAADLKPGEEGSWILPGGAKATFSLVPPEPEDDGMIIHNTKLDGSKLYTVPDKE